VKYTLFFILALTITNNFAQSAKNIENKINTILTVTNTPGAAIAVVRNDSIYVCKGFGYRNIEKQYKVDEQTVFSIGSSTKAFTAALIGIADYQDVLNIDRSPLEYLDNLSFYNNEMDAGGTIRDLLSHRTGLPRHDLSWYLFPEEDKQKLLKRLKYLEPFTSIRQKYHYNNYMYMLLGNLAEKSLGSDWQKLIEKHLFFPLEMKNSSTETMSATMENVSMGYETAPDGTSTPMPYYDLMGMSPAGSINSSATDLANWVKCWLNEGKYKEKQVLPKTYFIEAISSQMVMRANLPDEEFKNLFFSNYGFGWMLSSYKGYYRVEHGGNINGFSANVSFFPSESLGIVVLTNQNNSDAPYLIRNTISDMLLEAEETDWVTIHKKEERKKDNGKTNKEETKEFNGPPLNITGSFLNKGYGEIKIHQQKNNATAVFPVGHFDLFRTEEFQFRLISRQEERAIDTQTVPELLFDFDFDEEGQVKGVFIQMEPTLEPLYFQKTD